MLADSHPWGMLWQIVSVSGNVMLDDDTEDAAAAWLNELCARLRKQLDEISPTI